MLLFLLLHYNNFRAAVCMPAPLGMESGAILDSQITASSIWHPNYAAQQARLHFKAGGGKSGSWSSLFNDNNQWLQVDLQQTTRVKGIATQGKNAYSQWVTQYKLQYGEDGHTFKFYRQKGDHLDTVWFSSCQGGGSSMLFSNHSAVKREQIIFILNIIRRRQGSGIGISFNDS